MYTRLLLPQTPVDDEYAVPLGQVFLDASGGFGEKLPGQVLYGRDLLRVQLEQDHPTLLEPVDGLDETPADDVQAIWATVQYLGQERQSPFLG